jgi:Na+/H+ antiporter NhaD/arsenite permease-like protein
VVSVFGQSIGGEKLAGMAVFVATTLVSLRFTPRTVRQGNDFNWHPMVEIGKLFAALFITVVPVLDMLAAGPSGPLAPLLRLARDAHGELSPLACFWLAGVLSAFLDSAPSYLVFFQLAGGDAARLTGELSPVLTAISAGSVFFGALTYIGNAPNMMVRSIAAHRGVKMPGFFVYLGLASVLLLPLFGLLGLFLR